MKDKTAIVLSRKEDPKSCNMREFNPIHKFEIPDVLGRQGLSVDFKDKFEEEGESKLINGVSYIIKGVKQKYFINHIYDKE